MKKLASVIGFAPVLLLACLLDDASAAERPERPNILLAIGDNWAYPHAGAYGDRTARTPAFDRVAREGVLFTHSFCDVPSCSPARAVLLTGQAAHRLEDAASLHSLFPRKFRVYRIDQWMRKTADPRLDPDCDVFDKYPYFGNRLGQGPPPKPR